jgi:hypothetical protein
MTLCLSLAFILAISLARVAHATTSCVAFDINWNLLAFGFNGKDYNAGTVDTWATGALNFVYSRLSLMLRRSFIRYCDRYNYLRSAVSGALSCTR